MPNGVIETKKQVIIDGIPVNKLPDCPRCGRNEYTLSADGQILKCPCGARYNNRGKV